MPARSNEFQKVIHLIHRQVEDQATVTESKELRNRVTGRMREVDVVIETQVAGASLTVSVECVDLGRPADVTWVEEMHGKHEDLPTNKLVLVSDGGFTPQALEEAARFGYDALTLEEAMEVEWNAGIRALKRIYLGQVQLTPTNCTLQVESDVPQLSSDAFDPDPVVYQPDGDPLGLLSEVVMRALHDNQVVRQALEIAHPRTDRTFTCTIDPGLPYYLVDRSGAKRAIQQIIVKGKLVAPERIAIDLRHHSFRDAHVAHGSVDHPSGNMVFTAVYREGKAGTAELSLPAGRVGEDRIITFSAAEARERDENEEEAGTSGP